MTPKRSDQSVAIYGILILTAIGLIGTIALALLDKPVPEVLATGVVLSGMAGVLGWARGGTYYDPTREVVPSPVEPTSGPQPFVYPTATGPDNHTAANAGQPIDYRP